MAMSVLVAACSGGGERSAESEQSSASTTRLSPSSSEAPGTTAPCNTDASTTLDVPYAVHDDSEPVLTSLDVYSPERDSCEPLPVVVWVHGGSWVTGDKANGIADKAALFNDTDYVFVSINYRLTDVEADEPLRYPTHNEDVAEALAWVVENIGEYGGDPGRMAVLGHSAGAGIIAALATDARYLNAHELGLDALDCVAPLDTEAFDVPRVMRGGPRVVRTYTNVFGSDPDVWVEASPIAHVAGDSDIPPFLLARRGSPDRRSMVDDFATALSEASVVVTIIDAAGLTHEEIRTSIGAADDDVLTPPLMAFLENCFSPQRG